MPGGCGLTRRNFRRLRWCCPAAVLPCITWSVTCIALSCFRGICWLP